MAPKSKAKAKAAMKTTPLRKGILKQKRTSLLKGHPKKAPLVKGGSSKDKAKPMKAMKVTKAVLKKTTWTSREK